MAINLAVLTGRLTKNPELKYGASGTAYCKFTLAVNRMKKEDGADFILCSAFGKTAELIAEYVKKGYQLGVQGRIQKETYEKDGQQTSKTGVVVDKIEFLEGNKSDSKPVSKNGRIKQEDIKPDLPKKEEVNFDDDSDFEDSFPF